MSHERTPKPIRRRAGEAAVVGVAGVGAALLLSEGVGAQEVGRTPVAVDQLQENQRELFDACRFVPADLYTAPGVTRTDEVESGGDTDGVRDALFAITTPKPEQGLLAFSRSCLGVTLDTPDPDGTVLATVGALTKQITTDSGIEDPNTITTETQLTVNMSLIADMRRHLGTSPQSEPPPQSDTPQTQKPENPKPADPQPENPQLENSQTTTVAPNEGLLAVARRMNVDPRALAAANGLTLTPDYRIVDASGNRVTLTLGQELIIPTPVQANNPRPEPPKPENPQPADSETELPETQPANGPQAAWQSLITELATEEENPEYKALLEQAKVYEIDGRAVTYEDIQKIETERGPDSLSIVFSTAPPQPGTDEEIRSQIDPEKEDVMVAGFYDTCSQDLKWGLTCLMGPNAVPVAVWYIYSHREGSGKPPSAIVQYLAEKIGSKQKNGAADAEAYEAQILAIAQELGGEGADVLNYGGRPVLMDPQGNLVINSNGEMVSAAPDYKTNPTVAPDQSDKELITAIQKYDIIHFVQPNETTLTDIIRNQMQSLLSAQQLRLNPTQVNHLINLWTTAIVADRGGDDSVITGREIFIRNPGTIPELAQELVRLQAELNNTGPSDPNSVNSVNMNEGGSVGPESAIQFDDLRRIFRGHIIAEHLLLTQPEHARALYDSVVGQALTADQMTELFRQDLMNQIETGMLALGEQHATEAEYLAFIQSLTSTKTPEELNTILAALHIGYTPQPLDYVPDITKRGIDEHFDTFVSSYEIAELLSVAREYTHNKDFLEEHRVEFERLYPNLWPELMQELNLSENEADRVASETMREDLWEALKTDVYMRGLVDRHNMRVHSYPEHLDFLRNFRALVGEPGYQIAINDVVRFFEQSNSQDPAALTAGNQQLDAMILSAITRLAHDPSVVLPTEDPSYHDNLRPIQDHYVQSRDTLYSLAHKYGTTVEDLMALNGLSSDQIAVHTYLIVPQTDSIYPKNSGGMMSENMGPGAGPSPEDEEARYQQILAQIQNPAALLYIQIHPGVARAIILGGGTVDEVSEDLVGSLSFEVSHAVSSMREQHMPYEQVLQTLQQLGGGVDLTPFSSDILNIYTAIGMQQEAGVSSSHEADLIRILAESAPQYALIRQTVEENVDALRRLDPATFDEQAGTGLNQSEAIQRTYTIIASRLRAGIAQQQESGIIADPTLAAVQLNFTTIGGESWIQLWRREEEPMDDATISTVIGDIYQTYMQSRALRLPPSPDDNSMNRTDDAGAGSGMAGEGNGVEVQAGDTMTQPIAEADKRGDNAVDRPPSSWTNPRDYNPDGTPITPPGQEAMESPMVTPDMAGSMASENQGLNADQATAMAMSDGPNMVGSEPVQSTIDRNRTKAQEAATSPLTDEDIYRIIQEDGAAIEAYIQSENDKYGPDPMVQMAAMNNYIQTHPEEIRRIMEREWKKMHPDQEWDTRWVWEDIDPAVKDAVVKAVIVVVAAAAAAGNTLSGSGA